MQHKLTLKEPNLQPPEKTLPPESLDTDSIRKFAEVYHQLGFCLIPLLYGSKEPTVSWKRYQTERPSLSQVRTWFNGNDYNTGIITGKVSDLIVLDIDNPKAQGWIVKQGGIDKTPWVKTSRGWHIYMRYPEGVDFTKITPIEGLEIFGNSHYVVAPPSKHPSGQRYEWIYSPNDIPLAEPRPWIKKAVKRGVSGTFEGKSWKGAKFSDMAIPPKKKKAIPKITPAPDREGLREQIFNHYVWKGEAKKGSNNGLFLTRLIAHFRTGSEQEKATREVVSWCEGTVGKSKVRAAAKTTWNRGYGLKPQVIKEVSELDYEESYSFVNLVAQYDGWDTNQTEQKQLSPEVVTRRIIAVTFFYNLRFTTVRQLSESANIPYRTLYNRIREDRLPSYIKIIPINGQGVLVINLLPLLFALLFNRVRSGPHPPTFTNPLSSKRHSTRSLLNNPLFGGLDIPDT